MRRILIDTDPGIDDLLALLLAFASPEIQVEAVTTVSGNVGVEQTFQNALAFLHAIGQQRIPVAQGSAHPLHRTPIDAQYYHGSNGIGEITLPVPQQQLIQQPAVDLLVQQAKKHPGMLTLVAIGPLTNLAQAVQTEPGIVQNVQEVVIMGGALRTDGNVTPKGEFNIVADPHAADIVFHAGWPIRLVPLDVTNQARLRREHITQIQKTNTRVASYIYDMLEYNFAHHPDSHYPNTFPMHDPLCLASVVRPDFLTWEEVYVGVELRGEHTLGATVAYFPEYASRAPQPPNVQVAVGVDAAAFLTWYTDRICHYLRASAESALMFPK